MNIYLKELIEKYSDVSNEVINVLKNGNYKYNEVDDIFKLVKEILNDRNI